MARQVRERGREIVKLVPKPRDPERETVSVEYASAVLGISRTAGYALIRRDEFPVPVIRLGRRVVISKRDLEAVLNQMPKGSRGGDVA